HAQVTAPPGSAGEVRRFYGQVLGLAEIPVPAGMRKYGLIWFALGPQQLHVSIEDRIDRHKTHAHLAYLVDDIAAWRERIAGAGLKLFEQPLVPGYDRFHLLDPFGNRLEIIG